MISFQNTNKMRAKQSPLFPMLMCKLLLHTFTISDILMRYCFLLYKLYVSIVSILLPLAKLKYLYFIKTIESDTIYSLFYFKLNFLKTYILAVAKKYPHCIYLKEHEIFTVDGELPLMF